MDISVIGAAGAIGREIVAQIVAQRVLRPNERLQLVGHQGGASACALYGLRSDLMDAYDEDAPQIEVTLSPEEVTGDLVIMTAGETVGLHTGLSRDDVALANRPLLETYAQALVQRGKGHEVALMVTNPVELGVTIFARFLGSRRVIGIGAYSDSLRFRREIAADLKVPRQWVSGFVVGEHGGNLIPVWSSVRIYRLDAAETALAVTRLRREGTLADFAARVQAASAAVRDLLTANTRQAFETVDAMPPDVRMMLRPIITQLSGARTAMATANVTVEMARQIVAGHEMSVAGQVMLEGDDFYGIRGAFGAPLIVSNQGVVRVLAPPLWPEEIEAIHEASAAIQGKLAQWLEMAG